MTKDIPFDQAMKETSEEFERERQDKSSNSTTLSLFDQAMQEVSAEIEAERGIAPQVQPEVSPQPDQQEEDQEQGFLSRMLTPAANLWKSIGGGIAKAGFETKDFLVGEPEEDEKWDIRRDIEQRDDELRSQGIQNAIASSVAQFTTGMLGVGKLAAPLKVAKMGRGAKVGYEIARGAVTGAVVIDPHEERLSNLVQEFPMLENPVTEYLAASPDDSAAEGRFKNALEGIGMDLALVGVFAASTKALKLFKTGDTQQATKVLKAAEKTPEASVGATGGETIEQVSSPAKALGKKPPKTKPKAEVTESTAEEIIAGTRSDIEAIHKFGGRDEAIASGHKLGGSSKLPWQKLTDDTELVTFVSNTAKTLEGQLDTMKGGDVLSDVRVRQMVSQRADLFNEDPELLMGMVTKAGDQAKSMVANMEASYLVANKMFQDTYETSMKIKAGMLDDWGGDPRVAAEFLRDQIKTSAQLYGSARSMTAASGRALRRMRTEFRIDPEDLAKLDTMEPEKLADVLYHTKGDPKKIAETMSPSFLTRIMDEARFSLTNSLLWLYPTHVVNTTTNLYMLAARPTERVIGGLLMGSKGKGIVRQAAKEYSYTVGALSDGWSNAVEAFKRGDSVVNPHASEYFDKVGAGVDQIQLPWRKVESIADLAHNAYTAFNYRTIVGLPTRTLGAMDELNKTLRYRAVVQARAHVQGLEAGLKGAELGDHISRTLRNSFDGAGRGIDPAALKEAQVATFTQELLPGTFGKEVIQSSRANYPALTFILPFVKTPINVLRYSWKMTPGLNMLQGEYRQMISGALGQEAQAQAIGQMSMGAMFMGLAANLVLEGRITGGGPADNNLKKELMATGWKPYSFVTTDENGKKSYFPIGRFDPLGMPFGMIADLVEMQVTHPNTKEAEKGMGALVIALAKNFSEKTFLLNLNQAIRALSEPERNGSKFLGQVIGNTIPGSSAIRGMNPDPYLRDARGIIDNAMKNLPGYSETLPPQRDFLGQPMMRRIGLTSTESGGKVHQEHNRMILETGYGIGKPGAVRNGVDLRDIKLDDGSTAYDKFLEFSANEGGRGRTLEQTLQKLIDSKTYQRLPDGPNEKGTKLYAFAGVVLKYREEALKKLKREYPEVRKALVQRRLDIRAAYYNKQSENNNPVSEALDALGIK